MQSLVALKVYLGCRLLGSYLLSPNIKLTVFVIALKKLFQRISLQKKQLVAAGFSLRFLKNRRLKPAATNKDINNDTNSEDCTK